MQNIEELLKNLNDRGFTTYYVENINEAEKTILSLIPEDANVGSGGSVTLDKMDIRKKLYERGNGFLYSNKFNLDVDRNPLTISNLNWFMSSINALTKKGEIINTDGSCNRIANTIYGPMNILFVVGVNKIVKNLEEGFDRIEKIAIPLNLKRLNASRKENEYLKADDIKRATLIMHRPARGKNVHIILINQELGY